MNVIDYVEISEMDWTSTLFQAESKQANEKTKGNNKNKKKQNETKKATRPCYAIRKKRLAKRSRDTHRGTCWKTVYK